MNDTLYYKKNEYANLIDGLNSVYDKLEDLYNNLNSVKKNSNKMLTIDEEIYDIKSFNNIIKSIEVSKEKIRNNLLPQARYQYNNILLEISKLQ